MNIKFLDKVCGQILSETRIIDNKVYTPFSPLFLSLHFYLYPFSSLPLSLTSHCKEVYSLNKEETEYIWGKYKKELVSIIDKKELSYE